MLVLDTNESRSGGYASAPLTIARQKAAMCRGINKGHVVMGRWQNMLDRGAGGCGIHHLPLMDSPLSVPQPSPPPPYVDSTSSPDTPPPPLRSCTPPLPGSILPPILPELLDKGLQRSTRRLRMCPLPISVGGEEIPSRQTATTNLCRRGGESPIKTNGRLSFQFADRLFRALG